MINLKNTLLLVYVLLSVCISAEADEYKSYEMPDTQVIPIKDSQSGKQYELYIKLPEDYSKDRDTKYPVIYFTDAVWHIELLSAATQYLMGDVILVGVSWQKDIAENLKKEHGVHVSRFADYTFKKTPHPKLSNIKLGQANNHLAFIRNDVFKYIENTYRTDTNNRSYFGYSLGGLFGAYTLLTQPDTFKNYMLGAPSIKQLIKDDLKIEFKTEPKHKKHNANVLITHGDLEKERDHIKEFTDSMKKNHKNLSINYAIVKGNHQTAFPLAGVRSVRWLSNLIKNETHIEFPVMTGPYMGQTPPGLTAVPFAPGIISKEGWEVEGVFAPGMKEFYFTTRRNKDAPISVIGFRQVNDVWKKHIEFKRKGELTFSPDGQRMYMAKGYKQRVGDDWSERKSLGPMFDRADWGIMRLSASANGTYVFDDYKSGDVIRISTLKDGKRQEPKKMGPMINTGKWTAHPFIAPDESYLIWDSEREGGYGDSDLYISFKQDDGEWGAAINMGDKVNSDKWDAYASVTPDGKYILFNRRIDAGSNNDNINVDIYWVDAKIIEKLRP